MANARKPSEAPGPDDAADDGAPRNPRTLSESAQQVWLAGLGAFGRAQAEGGKLFDALVREGATLEESARRVSRGPRAAQVREAVEGQMDRARATATDSWSRLEAGFEERMTGLLSRMGVPTGKAMDALRARVDALDAEIARRDAAEASSKRAGARSSASAPGAAADKPASPPRARRAAAARPTDGGAGKA